MPTEETIGSIFRYLFESSDMRLKYMNWPPDAFCFAALALQKSSAYTHLIGSDKPTLRFRGRGRKSRGKVLEELGRHGKKAAVSGKQLPEDVINWFGRVKKHRDLPLGELAKNKSVMTALINLLAAADESCEHRKR